MLSSETETPRILSNDPGMEAYPCATQNQPCSNSSVPRENVVQMAKSAGELGWQMTAPTTGSDATDLLLEAYEAADHEKSNAMYQVPLGLRSHSDPLGELL